MSKLGDALDALTIAAPFAMAPRRPEFMAACYDMSFAGCEVLRRLGFDARLLPCVVCAHAPDRSVSVVLGMSEAEARSEAGPESELLWDQRGEDASDGHHVAIEVKHRGARAVVDLTIGQLRRFGVPTRLATWWWHKDWPSILMGDWPVWYQPSPRADEALERVRLYENRLGPLVDDLDGLTRLARRCADVDLFLASLQASQPATYHASMTVINSWIDPEPAQPVNVR